MLNMREGEEAQVGVLCSSYSRLILERGEAKVREHLLASQ